jgi:glycosyltransferase involved in cell wall biosynthesis
MPSRWESGPLTALEAMAAGTPIAAYDVGGLGEYVTKAGSGIAVHPDPDLLRAAVEQLYWNPEVWNAAAACGRRSAELEHSPSTYLPRLEQIYAAAVHT